MSNESPLLIEQAAVVGQNVSVSMNFLDNLARENLEVREVRIVATPVDATGAPAYPKDPSGNITPNLVPTKILGLAALLDFGLRLQSTYLTVPRRVPAEVLRSPFFDSLSEPEDSTTFTPPVNNSPLSSIPQRAIVWTFPEPLFVPAGAKMYAELFYNAGEGANAFIWDRLLVQVTLVAQRVGNKAMPEKSRIPYATTFRTPKQQLQGPQPQEFTGQDFQLKNHCKEPLCVQRLTAYNTGADRMPTSVRYSTSQGRFINRQLAPILELHSNGALNLNTILEPNEFIAVEGVIDGSLEPSLSGEYEQQAIFGLVGYREVDTAVLWSDALRDVTPGQPINPVAPPVLPYVVDLPPVKSRLPELPLPRTPQPPYTPWKKW